MDKLPDQVLYYLHDAERIFLAMLTHRWMEQTCRLWEDQVGCVWLILVRSRQMKGKAESF